MQTERAGRAVNELTVEENAGAPETLSNRRPERASRSEWRFQRSGATITRRLIRLGDART